MGTHSRDNVIAARRRHRLGRALPTAVAVGCLLLAGRWAPAAAQVRDTVPPPPDTTQQPPPQAADSLQPPPQFPMLNAPPGAQQGWGADVWVWDRDALLGEPAVSLGDLLRQIPDLMVLRPGLYLQPVAATAYGGTAPQLRIEIDGYVLDPLTTASYDLSQIELAQLEEVRVERRPDLIRIRLRTATPTDPRTYSRVEAGVGQPSGNLFRGVFLKPNVIFGPLGLAVDRFDTDGQDRSQPANTFAGWVKWGWYREHAGVQVEYRQNRLERSPDSPWPETLNRRDLIFRARVQGTTGLTGEVYAGHSSDQLDPALPADVADSLGPQPVQGSTWQYGIRGAFAGAHGTGVEVALRSRSDSLLPGLEASLEARAAPRPWLRLAGEIQNDVWRQGRGTTAERGRIDIGPFLGVQLFADVADGKRATPSYDDSGRMTPWTQERKSVRLGGLLEYRGLRAGASVVRLEVDSVPPFGLPFDSATGPFAGGQVSGWEGYGRLPLLGGVFALQGWYTKWVQGPGLAYLPNAAWRSSLEVHTIPLPSGNLEIKGWVEALHRGATLLPDLQAEERGTLLASPEYTTFNAQLEIRIVDVRLFVRYDNLRNKKVEPLPGYPVSRQRILYGAKWDFWN